MSGGSGAASAPLGMSHAQATVLGSSDLLQKIFRNLEFEQRLAAVPLVCHAFAAAHGAPGECWQDLQIDGLRVLPPAAPPSAVAAARFWHKLAAWISQRAAALTCLGFHNLRHLLGPLEPDGRLAALAALWAPLAPALRTLGISRSSVALAPGSLASMACLTALYSLQVSMAGPLDTAELDLLGDSLTHLQVLEVCLLRQRGMHCSFNGAFPQRLTKLKRLRCLRLEAPYSALNAGECQLPDSIAEWTQMRELHLINLGLTVLPEAVGQLSALQELCLGRNRLGANPGSLPPQLRLLPALRRLELQYNGFEAGPPAVLGELAALQELNLAGNLWGSGHADLSHELAQLRLRYLTLTNCDLRELPPVVRSMSQLILLKVNINKLETLPAGPYLRSLECLDLAHNPFSAGYPPALAAATNLQQLAFQHQGVHYSDPAAALQQALAPLAAHAPAPVQAAAAVAAAMAVVHVVPLPAVAGEPAAS